MKFLHLALLCLSVSAAHAQQKVGVLGKPPAQQRLWDWTVPPTPNLRFLASAAMNPDASGAFVIQERVINRFDSDFTLVWVNSRGVTLLTYPLGNGSYNTKWELVFNGSGKLVANNGHYIHLFEITRGKAAWVHSISQSNSVFFGGATFSGWLTHRGTRMTIPFKAEVGTPGTPGYTPGTDFQQIENADTITAWRF